MDYKVISLRTILNRNKDKPDVLSKLSNLLNEFKCPINHDEEDFLWNKAINYEYTNKARTYLMIDKNNILSAYFSLAIKSVDFKHSSVSQKKKISGGESNPSSNSAYLIGHLAKNQCVKEKLGDLIIDYALDILRSAQKIVGGRFAYIDCKDNKKLIDVYESYGFKRFNISESGLLQFYYILVPNNNL